MYLVGLTGGIASGKSSVSKMFSELGVPIVDADAIAVAVVEPGRPAWHKLRAEFGPQFFDNDGHLLRRKLGEFVFSDSNARRKLNKITHYYIQKEMLKEVICLSLRGHQFAILDVPLLFESSLNKLVQKTVVVYCTEKQQLSRLISRTEYSDREAQDRIAAQMPLATKCSRADVVIDNSGDIEDTRQQVLRLHGQLCSSWLHWIIRAVPLTVIVLGGLAIWVCVFK